MQPLIRLLLAETLSDTFASEPDVIARMVAQLRAAAARHRYALGLETATELHLLANAIELEIGMFDCRSG